MLLLHKLLLRTMPVTLSLVVIVAFTPDSAPNRLRRHVTAAAAHGQLPQAKQHGFRTGAIFVLNDTKVRRRSGWDAIRMCD
mgnify:CR=1 FL=1